MRFSVGFMKDIMNYFSDTYPYKLYACSPMRNHALVFEYLVSSYNDIQAKYIPCSVVEEIFSLWESGELDKDRNKPLWQIEFENYLEGS